MLQSVVQEFVFEVVDLPISLCSVLTRLICLRFRSVSDTVFKERPMSFDSSVGVFFAFDSIFKISYAVGFPSTLQNREAR